MLHHHTNNIEKRARSVAYKAFLDHFSATGNFEEAKQKATEAFQSFVVELGLLEIERFIFERRFDEGKKRASRNRCVQRKN